MQEQAPLRTKEATNWDFFLSISDVERGKLSHSHVKDVQLLEPLFEFSGACAGCGETPYIKLLTQLFGDRLLIANATGCSSIYGGNLPTTPYAQNADGRGPAWSNSLFEDNAEFGLGMRLAVDKRSDYARELLRSHADWFGESLVAEILQANQFIGGGNCSTTRAGWADQAEARESRFARSPGSASGCRCAGAKNDLDRGRRRLGLRYRSGRPGSRSWFGHQCQCSRAWIPRFTRTRAARCRKRRHVAQWRNMRPAEKDWQEGPRDGGVSYGSVYVAAWRWVAATRTP